MNLSASKKILSSIIKALSILGMMYFASGISFQMLSCKIKFYPVNLEFSNLASEASYPIIFFEEFEDTDKEQISINSFPSLANNELHLDKQLTQVFKVSNSIIQNHFLDIPPPIS